MAIRKKIFVAVSGGVDSSVALALLKKEGHDVTGCFMKNWSQNIPGLECNWVGDREDAMRVCAALGVPFKTVDLEKAYYEKVFKNFIAEYKRCRTPNPDILCNSEVKFKAFLNWALAEGADMIATGHYARIMKHEARSKNNGKSAVTYSLLAGRDKNKDQSYFLFRLGQKELRYTLFPVGNYTKPEVRQLARSFNLPTAEKKDSQGVCFMGEVALPIFLKNWIPEKPGDIHILPEKNHSNIPQNVGISHDLATSPIGQHAGVRYFTIGQRHGLGTKGGGTPLYVAAKDCKNDVLFVAPKNHPSLYSRELVLEKLHWVSGVEPRYPLNCSARIRYRQPLQKCVLKQDRSKKITIDFLRPQWACASGQSVVFYNGQKVIGGGIIKTVEIDLKVEYYR
jgi:tRNA-uridine 2-sulfurtransferase